MIRFLVALAISALCVAVGDAAEDHSHHQHPPPNVAEHAEHRATSSNEPTPSERAHVPPDPPSLVLGDMSNERMIELMQMEDDAPLGMIGLDQFEYFHSEDTEGIAWDLNAWYGTDIHKLWLKVEGDQVDDDAQSRVELLWDRIVSPWWSVQAGVRHDVHEGPSRTWAALGVQGTAPYFVAVEATLYVGEQGRSAARLSAGQEWLVTQRLIVEPEAELTAYGKDDLESGLAAGLSEFQIGLRVRYEFIRELAPYIGVEWERKLGNTEDLVRSAAVDPSELKFVAGVRAWF